MLVRQDAVKKISDFLLYNKNIFRLFSFISLSAKLFVWASGAMDSASDFGVRRNMAIIYLKAVGSSPTSLILFAQLLS
jgi:hypothetical protein